MVNGRWQPLITAFLFLGISAAATHAAPIYGDPADYTGSRTTSVVPLKTLSTNPDITDKWQNVTLSWTVVANPNDTFTYSYAFTGIDKGISHFDLDISDNAVGDANAITNATANGLPIPLADVKIDSNIDGIITGGVKFNVGEAFTGASNITYVFTSNRAPVWGDFYLKDGGGNVGGDGTIYARNTGFGNQTSTNMLDYIARPDGVVVPEPAGISLLGLGGLALLWRKR